MYRGLAMAMAAMAASDEAHKKNVLIGKMHGKSIGNPQKKLEVLSVQNQLKSSMSITL